MNGGKDLISGPATVTLPAGSVWRISRPGCDPRWLRPRTPHPLPAGTTATRCPWGEPHLEDAPAELRWLWRLTEAAPGWGWQLRPVTADITIVGWELTIENPDGSTDQFTWLGGELITARATLLAITSQLTPILSGA